ncbi:hypothetical protein [Sphaerisporangium aureirubrum]|uniref:Uncharacterized protein n=1 Tax=Sphaerisporangium aureirubrum TaxID=1544736 RepID=A0ABW1NFS2_9ACTN
MTLGIGTSPALSAGFASPDRETSTFSPPAQSLLVAAIVGFDAVDEEDFDELPQNTGTALEWSRRASDDPDPGVPATIRFYTAPNVSAQTNITVSARLSNGEGMLKVWMVTEAALSAPVGATGAGTTSGNNVTPGVYTSTVAGSRGFIAAYDENNRGVPTSTDAAEGYGGGTFVCGLVAAKAANTPGAGTGVTFNLDAAGSGGGSWLWVAIEVLPRLDPSRPIRVMQVGQAVKRGTIW